MVLDIFCELLKGVKLANKRQEKEGKNPFEKLVYECQRFQMRGCLEAKKERYSSK